MEPAPDPRGPVANVLSRLHKAKRASGGWVAQCPAHEDRNPSLSIGEGNDGRVLLNCHAGCTVQAIVSALGITEADLFPPKDDQPTKLVETATYRYEDETGQHLYDVVRFQPKTFRQRRPNGEWGLKDTRRVIYRLPQVRAAIDQGDTIYIVEGEKDVHAIEKAGGTATCNPMGAGKWHDDYTRQLDGATHAVIVADNDEPGQAHANSVAQSLERASIPHRIVLPAAGKDAADHLAAGNTLDELVPLLKTAATSPVAVETWRQFADSASQTVPCLVDDLWPEASLGFIASAPKKGKTWLGLSLALSVATGTRYLDRYDVPQPRTVLYVALEGHRTSLTHRIGCLARGLGIDPDKEIPNLHIAYKPRGLNIADPAWAEHLRAAATELGASLVIVDVLRAAALIKENSAEDFALLRSNLATLLEGGCSLAFLHHFTKLSETSKERTPAERMSGSGAMYGALDVGIFITGSDDGARTLRLDFEARDIAAPEQIGIKLDGTGSGPNGGLTYRDRAWWTPTITPDEDDLAVTAEEIRDWLLENGGKAEAGEIALAFDVSDKTVHRRRHLLSLLGIHWQQKPGKKGHYVHTPDNPQVEVDTGQDTLDTCPGSAVSGVNPSIHAETGSGQDTPDTNPCPGSESADLQGKRTPDTPDSPTERDDPVSGVSPEPPEDDYPYDDGIPW